MRARKTSATEHLRATVVAAAGALPLLAVALAPSPAAAAQCGSHQPLVEQLQSKFQEQRQATGLAGDGAAMMELYIAESGTWTVVIAMANGMSCIVAAGSNWDGETRLAGSAI